MYRFIIGNFHFDSRSNECDGGKGEKSLLASFCIHFFEAQSVSKPKCIQAGVLNVLKLFK